MDKVPIMNADGDMIALEPLAPDPQTWDKRGFARKDMEQVVIAFDIDGTLISNAIMEKDDTANVEIVQLLVLLSKMKNVKIVVWSGGGVDYAAMWVRRLGIGKYVWKTCCKCPDIKPHIAIDDIHEFAMADVNLIVRQK